MEEESEVWHPDVEDIVIIHDQVGIISEVRTQGFRSSEEWGISKLEEIINEAEEKSGIYQSAGHYLKKIILDQPFSDGNHRTAYLVVNQFLQKNGGNFAPESELSQDEIVEYLKSEAKFNTTAENAKWVKGDFDEI